MSEMWQIERSKLQEFAKLNQYYLEELKQAKTNVNKFEVAEWLIDLGKIIEDSVRPVECASDEDQDVGLDQTGQDKKTFENRIDDLERRVEELNGSPRNCGTFTSESDTKCFRITKIILFVCHLIVIVPIILIFIRYVMYLSDFHKYTDSRLEDLHPDVLKNMTEQDIEIFRNKHKVYIIMILVVSVLLYHQQLLVLVGVYIESRVILIIYTVLATILAIFSIFSFSIGSYLSAILIMVGFTSIFLYMVYTKTGRARKGRQVTTKLSN